MSKTIDDRIVRMTFDSSKFQNGVKGVLDGLKKIDTSLAAKRTFSGLDSIGRSISDVTHKGMGALSKSINDVAGEFSALDVVAITALGNITTMAMNAGGRILKSFTIAPIMDGFTEYETKMQSIQTILTNTASKGTTLKEVTATLDELNEYADMTIYNFAAMTKNIGTFTAAGVGLKDATTAIKGIANLGAGSGSTNQQVETAMYQMSQALSTGHLMLQDYNSLVNAGMGGELFKTEAIKVAKSMGIATPAIKDFRDSLKDGWLTDNVMMKVFENFANNDMLTKAATEVKTFTGLMDTLKESVGSGWAQTWESIIGDKDQAAQLFTGISDAINNGLINPLNDARKAVVDTWLDMGGRENTIKGFANIFENLGRIIGPIGAAFGKVFPKSFGELLGNISKGFLKLTESLMISEEFSGFIGDAFTGLAKILQGVGKAIGWVLQPFKHLFSLMGNIGRVVGSAITAFIRMAYAVGDYVRELQFVKDAQNAFNNVMKVVSDIVDKFVKAFNKGAKNVSDFFNNIVKAIDGFLGKKESVDGVAKSMENVADVGDLVKGAFEGIKAAGRNLKEIYNDARAGTENAVEGFITFLGGAKDYILNSSLVVRSTELMTQAWDAMCGVGNQIKGFIDSIDFSPIVNAFQGVKDALSPIVGFIKNIFDKVVGAFRSLFDELDLTGGQIIALLGGFAAGFGVFKILGKLTDLVSGIFNPIGDLKDSAIGVLDAAKGALESYQNDLQASTLKKIGVSVLFLAGGLLILSQLELSEVQTGLLGIVGIVATVVGGLSLLTGIVAGANLKGFFGLTAAFISLSIAVVNMSVGIFLLSSLDMQQLSVGLLGIAGGVTALVLGIAAVSTMTGSIVKAGFALMLIAGAINTLFVALFLFTKQDPADMNNAIVSVGLSLAILVVACKSLDKVTGNIPKTAFGMILLAGAINLLATAVKKFGKLDLDVLVKGLSSVTLVIGALALFNKLTEKSKLSFSMGAGMMAFAKALQMLYKPVKKFGELKVSELAKGLVSLGLVMGGVTLMLNKLKPQNSLALMKVSAGLVLFAGAISMFCKTAVKLKDIDMWAMAQGLLNMALVMGTVGLSLRAMPDKKLWDIAGGLIAFSVAFRFLSSTIEKAGQMDMGTMLKGFLALAGGLLFLEYSMRLTPVAGMVKMAGGLIALSGAMMIMGVAVSKLGQLDFMVIAKGLGTMLGVIGLLKVMSIGGLAGSMGMTGLAVGIGALSLAMLAMMVPIRLMGQTDLKTIGIGLMGIAAVLGVLGLAAVLLTPAVPVLFGLATSVGLLGSGLLATAGGLTVFSAGFAIFALTVSMFGDELLEFFKVLTAALPEIATNLGLAFVAILEVIGQNGDRIVTATIQIIGALLKGLIACIPIIANTIVHLVVTILGVIETNVPKLLQAGSNLIIALLNGIERYIPPVLDKMVELLIAMANALNNNVIILIDAGIQLIVNLIQGIADGIEANGEALSTAINDLIFEVLTLTGEFTIGFFKRGGEFIGDMVKGIFGKKDEVETTSTDVADAGVKGAESTKSEWKSAGTDFSSGIKSGIESGRSGVVATATSVARSAAAAVKRELDINSPSRVMAELGKFTSQGLAVGIEKFGKLVYRSAGNVANETVNKLQQPLNNVSLLDGIDSNLTIKPVMDLSNVRNGSRIIGDLINGAAGSIGSFGTMGGLATNVGVIQNGKGNNDVVKAIGKLRNDISNLQGTTNVINGITYDDGSAITNTIGDLVRMARVERRK